jgi:hypothetical protein
VDALQDVEIDVLVELVRAKLAGVVGGVVSVVDAAATTGVNADRAMPYPEAFHALTTTFIVKPRSLCVIACVDAVAPESETQFAPALSQSFQA